MKFTFGPLSPLSKILYSLSLPVLLLCWLDLYFSWLWIPDKLRWQVVSLAIILAGLAAMINLSLFIKDRLQNPPESH